MEPHPTWLVDAIHRLETVRGQIPALKTGLDPTELLAALTSAPRLTTAQMDAITGTLDELLAAPEVYAGRPAEVQALLLAQFSGLDGAAERASLEASDTPGDTFFVVRPMITGVDLTGGQFEFEITPGPLSPTGAQLFVFGDQVQRDPATAKYRVSEEIFYRLEVGNSDGLALVEPAEPSDVEAVREHYRAALDPQAIQELTSISDMLAQASSWSTAAALPRGEAKHDSQPEAQLVTTEWLMLYPEATLTDKMRAEIEDHIGRSGGAYSSEQTRVRSAIWMTRARAKPGLDVIVFGNFGSEQVMASLASRPVTDPNLAQSVIRQLASSSLASDSRVTDEVLELLDSYAEQTISLLEVDMALQAFANGAMPSQLSWLTKERATATRVLARGALRPAGSDEHPLTYLNQVTQSSVIHVGPRIGVGGILNGDEQEVMSLLAAVVRADVVGLQLTSGVVDGLRYAVYGNGVQSLPTIWLTLQADSALDASLLWEWVRSEATARQVVRDRQTTQLMMVPKLVRMCVAEPGPSGPMGTMLALTDYAQSEGWNADKLRRFIKRVDASPDEKEREELWGPVKRMPSP